MAGIHPVDMTGPNIKVASFKSINSCPCLHTVS